MVMDNQETKSMMGEKVEKYTVEDFDVIREMIHSVMKEKKIKSVELANAIGIGKSSISSYLSGRHGLSSETIVKAFKFLGIWFTIDGKAVDEHGKTVTSE